MGKSVSKWVEFTRNYDFRHPSRATTAYKDGMRLRVPSHVAEAALRDGAAIESSDPKKDGEGEGEVFLNG